MKEIEPDNVLLSPVREIVLKAKQLAYKSTNSILLNMYWEIGKLIVEQEQEGSPKAGYGKGILRNLSNQLTIEFGKGFDERNLNNIRAFYLAFPIWNAVRTELSWTHYRILSRIETENLRVQYVQYAIEGDWNTRTLQRNINTQYLGRTLEMPKQGEKTDVQQLIKDPYIFEFLGLPGKAENTERTIEAALINHLQQFLMELLCKPLHNNSYAYRFLM